jgi:hypothetical protein
VPLQPLESPAAWRVEDLKRNTDWLYQLSEADIAELEAAIQHALATGKEIQVRAVCGAPAGHLSRAPPVCGAQASSQPAMACLVLSYSFPPPQGGRSITESTS